MVCFNSANLNGNFNGPNVGFIVIQRVFELEHVDVGAHGGLPGAVVVEVVLVIFKVGKILDNLMAPLEGHCDLILAIETLGRFKSKPQALVFKQLVESVSALGLGD